MIALWENGSLCIRDIGALLSTDSGTLSPLLNRLEAAGLVTRQRDEVDQRQIWINLTARGHALHNRASAAHKRVVQRLGLNAAELEDLRQVLVRLTQALTSPAA